MTVQLSPYITFEGGAAREAMEFYRSVFGGELAISTFGEFNAIPAGAAGADLVMHAQLTAPDLTLMASDLPPGMPARPGDTVTLTLWGDDEERLRGWFDGLAADGAVGMALERQVWGDVYGDLRDRFGVRWSFNIGAGG